ncbi:hypothetical protein [Streptomyces sp. KL116D]|uniref:hypothetical protein n=1 Tax=Streptomyces sp. KL116D TaxID=3045152 RepID=UPI00355643C5
MISHAATVRAATDGAGRGVGRAVVRALTAEGVRVVAAARTVTPELEAFGVVPVKVDLADPAGAEHLVAEAGTRWAGSTSSSTTSGRRSRRSSPTSPRAAATTGTDHRIDGGAVKTA